MVALVLSELCRRLRTNPRRGGGVLPRLDGGGSTPRVACTEPNKRERPGLGTATSIRVRGRPTPPLSLERTNAARARGGVFRLEGCRRKYNFCRMPSPNKRAGYDQPGAACPDKRTDFPLEWIIHVSSAVINK